MAASNSAPPNLLAETNYFSQFGASKGNNEVTVMATTETTLKG